MGIFVLVNGGNKCISAKRYVHGIIQFQVREQVLPKLEGLAEPGFFLSALSFAIKTI